MSTKNEGAFARRGRELATSIAQRHEDLLAWRGVYWDRAYNAGGLNEITDEEVAELGITVADLTGMVAFADALESFLVANKAYLSKMRQDM